MLGCVAANEEAQATFALASSAHVWRRFIGAASPRLWWWWGCHAQVRFASLGLLMVPTPPALDAATQLRKADLGTQEFVQRDSFRRSSRTYEKNYTAHFPCFSRVDKWFCWAGQGKSCSCGSWFKNPLGM